MRKNIGQRLDAAAKRLFKQQPLRGHELILFGTGDQGIHENTGGTRLGEETKDVAFVNSADRRLKVSLPGEQYAHGVGSEPSSMVKKFDAGHIRHAQIREYDCERTLGFQNLKPFGSSHGRLDRI